MLQFSEQRYSYITSKPIHWSQKIKDAQRCIVSISVIPNKELISLLLSFGDDVLVLSPDEIRQEIAMQIIALQQKYNLCR
jgi:predicted DNA-binding transcriptional regulator YafY